MRQSNDNEAVEWNFGDLFDALAPVLGDRPALIHGDVIRTWKEFGERSNRLARALISFGLRPDDKVAFYLRNSPAYLELFAACVKARLVHVNVNYRYVENELLHIFENSDAKAVVFDTEFAEHVNGLRSRLPTDTVFIAVEPILGAEVPHEGPPWAASFALLTSRGDAEPLGNRRSGNDLYFQYTGGTTGLPKAVMWRQHDRIALFAMARGSNATEHAASVATRERYVTLLPACPLMHSTAFTTAIVTLCAGGTVVTLTAPRFDALELLATIERRKVSALSIVGDAFSRPLLDVLRTGGSAFALGSVNSITSAGVMWSSESKTELLNYFTNAVLRDTLGSSEGSGLASAETRAGSTSETGVFAIGDNVKVFTDDFREVVPGSGELGRIAKSGLIPVGYYRDEAKTAETFPVVDGVRYTIPGDWCSVEEDGTIRLVGRGSTCINTGGEKVFPEEVEIALCRLDAVADALVVGVADDRWGQVVGAVVQREAGADVGAESLLQQLRRSLAGYKIPKRLCFVEKVPRAANGKADYASANRELAELANRD